MIPIRLLLRRASTMPISAEVVGNNQIIRVSKGIEEELRKNLRLFAIVFLNGRQWKVSENDLITLHDNLPLDIGDKIKLEKVLAVGGKNFTIFGRPFVNVPSVIVNATVVEKSTSYPQLKYTMINHAKIRSMLWMSHELTVLRINDIIVSNEL